MKIIRRIILISFISLALSCASDGGEASDQLEFKEFVVDVDNQTIVFSDNLVTDRGSYYHHDYSLYAKIYNNSKLVIKAFDYETEQSVTLVVGDAFSDLPLKVGRYIIGAPNGEYPLTNIYFDNDDILGDNDEYYFNKNYGGHLTSSQVTGEIIISEIDKVNKRIKGSFRGALLGWLYEEPLTYVSSNMNLENGKFDMPYISDDSYEKGINLNKGIFNARIAHGNRDFTFLPTDGAVTGAGTRHFRIQLKINELGKPSELKIEVENENLGVLKFRISNYTDGFNMGVKYNFITDLYTDFSTNYNYIFFHDFYYNTGHVSSPIASTSEKNNSHFTIISINKEDKIIEGTFGTDNSTTGFNISDGYFKVKYDDL